MALSRNSTSLELHREPETKESVAQSLPVEILQRIFFYVLDATEVQPTEAQLSEKQDLLEIMFQCNCQWLETWHHRGRHAMRLMRVCTKWRDGIGWPLEQIRRETLRRAEEAKSKLDRAIHEYGNSVGSLQPYVACRCSNPGRCRSYQDQIRMQNFKMILPQTPAFRSAWRCQNECKMWELLVRYHTYVRHGEGPDHPVSNLSSQEKEFHDVAYKQHLLLKQRRDEMLFERYVQFSSLFQ